MHADLKKRLGKGKERRITKQLVSYWNELRDESKFPDFKAMNRDAIGDTWDDCFVVSVSGTGKHAKYEMVYRGPNVLSLFQEISPKAMEYVRNTLDLFFEQIVRTKRPAVEEAEFIPTDEPEFRFRLVMLPLSDSGDKIDMIVGGIRGQILPCVFKESDLR